MSISSCNTGALINGLEAMFWCSLCESHQIDCLCSFFQKPMGSRQDPSSRDPNRAGFDSINRFDETVLESPTTSFPQVYGADFSISSSLHCTPSSGSSSNRSSISTISTPSSMDSCSGPPTSSMEAFIPTPLKRSSTDSTPNASTGDIKISTTNLSGKGTEAPEESPLTEPCSSCNQKPRPPRKGTMTPEQAREVWIPSSYI
jgi:hypothetical protein